jgi:hypothetical protein
VRRRFKTSPAGAEASPCPSGVVTPRTDGESRRLLVVRHCQSEANRGRRAEVCGGSGPTQTGIKQAQRRAPHLRSVGIVGGTVVSNPLLRASQTAREIATAFGPRAKPDVRLADGDLDWMEGLSYSESSLMSAKGTPGLAQRFTAGSLSRRLATAGDLGRPDHPRKPRVCDRCSAKRTQRGRAGVGEWRDD